MGNQLTLAIICVFLGVMPRPVMAEAPFGLIVSHFDRNDRGYVNCLRTNGPDGIPNLVRCDDDELSQLWFVTYTTQLRKNVRSARYPNRCLTAIDDPDARRPNKVLTLRPCEGRGSQIWRPVGNDQLRDDGECAFAGSDQLYIQECGHNTPRQDLDLSDVALVDNFDIANFANDFPRITLPNGHRFAVYEACGDQNGRETTCFINLGDVQQYGHNFGTEFGFNDLEVCEVIPGVLIPTPDERITDALCDGVLLDDGLQVGGRLMDLGDRYSVDRCALAHDRHYWYKEGTTGALGPNDRNFLRCLYKVVPTTNEERASKTAGIVAFSAAMFGDLPGTWGSCFNENLTPGTLPSAGAPVHSCWCRTYLPTTRQEFAKAEVMLRLATVQISLGIPIADANIADLEAQLDVLKNDPIVTGDVPDSDASMKCGGDLAQTYGERITGIEAINKIDGPFGNVLFPGRDRIAGIEERIANLRTANDAFYTPTIRQIVRGDTLWDIAISKGVDDFRGYIAKFEDLNANVQPDLIYAGHVYQLPAAFSRE